MSNFRIYDQIYHRIGLLLLEEGRASIFAQLYIYVTINENKN